MKFDKEIFYELIHNQVIPIDGIFDITEEMKISYIELYSKYSGEGNMKSNSNKNYALKLAGLSLLKLNNERQELKENCFKKSSIKTNSGIIYLISNPSYENYLKIGITKNLISRLQTYQTYDPLRRFKVEHYKVVENARQQEKFFLSHHKINLAKGEWVEKENVKKLFLDNLGC